jgi:glucose-1-phosphate thymidylyltransferase
VKENLPVAVIPVAGVGSRLRPHTHTVPKALINVAGKAMVAHILDELIALGVKEFVLVVGYMGERVREYVEKHYPTLKVHYVEQSKREGLGHAIHLTRETVGERDLLIVLGDTIFRVDFEEVLGKRVSQIGVKEVEDPRRFGIVEMEGGQVKRFVEKPEHPTSRLAIVGIYYVTDTPALFRILGDMIERQATTRGEYQLTDALQTMLEEGIPMEVFAVEGWYDCGKPETLLSTNRELLDMGADSPRIEGSVVIPPVAIDPHAVIRDSVIGPYATIAARAVVECSVIRNSIVNEGARVKDVLLDASLVGEDAVVEGAFRRLNVGDSSEIYLT